MSSKRKKFYSSTRLKDYDYSTPGAYFITACTHRRSHIFGEVIGGEMEHSINGLIAIDQFIHLPYHYDHIRIDTFIVMPNHVHAIIWIVEPEPYENHEKREKPYAMHPLTEVVRGYKTYSAREINAIRQSKGVSVWQRGFYDHIIRDDSSLKRIRTYIKNNPLTWDRDHENVSRRGKDPFREWINAQAEKPIFTDQFPSID